MPRRALIVRATLARVLRRGTLGGLVPATKASGTICGRSPLRPSELPPEDARQEVEVRESWRACQGRAAPPHGDHEPVRGQPACRVVWAVRWIEPDHGPVTVVSGSFEREGRFLASEARPAAGGALVARAEPCPVSREPLSARRSAVPAAASDTAPRGRGRGADIAPRSLLASDNMDRAPPTAVGHVITNAGAWCR